jgi:hypothetical protein
MPTLSDLAKQPQKHDVIVADMVTVVEEEVSSKTGVTGLGIKAAFAMVKALKPGILREMCQSLLPDFAVALDPLVDARPAGGPVAPYMEKHQDRIVAALLSVTDARAKKADNATLLKAYNKLRPMAEKQVAASVPRLSRMLARHVPVAVAANAPAPGKA